MVLHARYGGSEEPFTAPSFRVPGLGTGSDPPPLRQRLRQRRREPRHDPHSPEPFVQAGGFSFEECHPLRSDVFEHVEGDGAVVVLPPRADDLPVPPRSGAGIAVRIEQLLLVRSELPVALEPTHRGGVERRQERTPGFDGHRFVDIIRQYITGTTIQTTLRRRVPRAPRVLPSRSSRATT